MTFQNNSFRELQALQSSISYKPEIETNYSLSITSDLSDDSTEPLEGILYGINFYVDKGTPFEPNCFHTLLFNDSGIWTKVKLFNTPIKNGPLFKDYFVSGCFTNYTYQALEIEYTSEGDKKEYPIDIGQSPIIKGVNIYPSYTLSTYWEINEEFITSKTFRIYSIPDTTKSYIFEGNEKTLPSNAHLYELLLNLDCANLYELSLDVDSFLGTNIEQKNVIDSCTLCIYVHLRNKDTKKIYPFLTLGITDNLPILYSFDMPSLSYLQVWKELSILAAKDFLIYGKSTGLIEISNSSSSKFIDYNPYFKHHFVPDRNNRNAYLDHSDKIYYWAPGAKDKDGNVYLIDIGIFPSCSDIPYLVQTNIPVSSDGSFYSWIPFPKGKKYIQVRKVTPLKESLILTYAPYVTSLLKTLNDNKPSTSTLDESWGLKDTKVNLEHLSITLLLLSISNYSYIRSCEHVYNPPLIHNEVIDLIRKNFSILYELRAPFIEPLNRSNSIPLNLKPITCFNSIYDDNFRPGKYLLGWEPGIWEEDCFDDSVYIESIDRTVSNRAVGWLCYALSVYRASINSDEFTTFLVDISNYLISNIHPTMHLISNGWTDTEMYQNSVQIDEYDLSTSCVCCLALIKSYEQTGIYKYLEAAVDIYQGIMKYLMLPEEGVCADNMSQDTISTETLIYSLWFFTEMGRVDIVERLISLLNIRIHSGKSLLTASLYQTSPNLGKVLYNGIDLIGSVELNPLLHPYSLLNTYVQSYEKTQTITNVIPQLLLLHGIRNLLPSENYLSIIDLIQTTEPLEGLETLLNEEVRIALYAALQLNTSNSFLNNTFVRIESRHLINSLIGYRNQVFSMIRASIPIQFGWFNQNALTISGTAGKLIWMLIRGVSSLIISKNRIKEQKDKENAIGLNFDTIIQDFNFYRQPGEDKYMFLDKYIAFKTRSHNTKDSILKLIELFKLPARLLETPTVIYEQLNTYNYHQSEFTSNLDCGIMNSFNKLHIITHIPCSPDFLQILQMSVPIGVEINIITHLTFPYSLQCLPELNVDMYILKNYSTIEPEFTVTYLPSNSPLVSSSFNVINLKLTNPFPNQLYVNYNPDLTSPISLSQQPNSYTISIIKSGVMLITIPIPK